jgi:hypothetical protein
LVRTLEDDQAIWDEGYRRPWPNVTVKLHSAGRSFETKADERGADAPFPATFFPQSTSFGTSQLIHLSDGQQISNANIHVRNPLPTRQITVRLIWGDKSSQDFFSPQVIAKATRGVAPYPFEAGGNSYTLNLLLNSRYTIHAEAFCRIGTTGAAETDHAFVEGNDATVTEVKLRFVVGECSHQ